MRSSSTAACSRCRQLAMRDVFDKIRELFPLAKTTRDETGSLAAVARLLQALDPSLVLVANRDGNLLAADDLGSEVDLEVAHELARSLVAHLANGETCTLEYADEREPRLAFGVRLTADARRAILGGLVRQGEDSRRQLSGMGPVLAVCGELVHDGILRRSDEKVLRTRIRHLLSEQDTLKISHAEAIATAIEQRDERLREQQYHDSLRELCQAAEAANRAKSQFLANVSHELRTPLHGILSFASFGIEKSKAAAAGDLLGHFQKIEHSGKVLLTLVDDLLDTAKLESGRTSFEFARTDLRLTILAVLEEFSSRAAQRDITIEFPGTDFDGAAVVDQSKIMQVLRNLLGNAVKFSPDGSTIEVAAERGEHSIVISVLDRGPGVPEEELESIFDKFIQSSTTRNDAGGTGLGLAICREIITAHHGHIWVRNRPEGGSEFSFEIPLNPHGPPPDEEAEDLRSWEDVTVAGP